MNNLISLKTNDFFFLTFDDNFVNNFRNLPPVKFKLYDFETDTKTARKIYNKIRAIFDLKS